MNVALKEWAVVVEALAAGRQLFLLRKGGIAEGKRGFELKHHAFLFFPTWEHQQADALQPEFRRLFEQLEPRRPGVIDVAYAGRVTDIVQAPALDQMRKLARHHIWADSFIKMRYEYRPDLPLFLVIVRLFRLAQPVRIPDDRLYAGCRSWVTLQQDINVALDQPAVADPEYAAARQGLLRDLGTRATRI